MDNNKDYCSFFPEEWYIGFSRKKVSIKECCYFHDEVTFCSTRQFYLCLKDKIGKFHATYIGFGGSVGCWVKYTKKMVNDLKIKYNNKNG